MAVEKKKRTYFYLTQEEKPTRLISFRVPTDFPLNSIEVKTIISEIGNVLEPWSNEVESLVEKLTAYSKKWKEEQSVKEAEI